MRARCGSCFPPLGGASDWVLVVPGVLFSGCSSPRALRNTVRETGPCGVAGAGFPRGPVRGARADMGSSSGAGVILALSCVGATDGFPGGAPGARPGVRRCRVGAGIAGRTAHGGETAGVGDDLIDGATAQSSSVGTIGLLRRGNSQVFREQEGHRVPRAPRSSLARPPQGEDGAHPRAGHRPAGHGGAVRG